MDPLRKCNPRNDGFPPKCRYKKLWFPYARAKQEIMVSLPSVENDDYTGSFTGLL